METSKSFQPRSKSPTPQSSTTPEIVPEKAKAHMKRLRNITDFNHAIDFIGLYHELQEQLNVNDNLLCPSIAANYELCDSKQESIIKKGPNFGYVNPQKSRDITYHLIELSNNKSRNIRLGSLIEDSKVNVKRPATLTMPLLTQRTMNDIKLTQSHFTVRDLDPVDEENDSIHESQYQGEGRYYDRDNRYENNKGAMQSSRSPMQNSRSQNVPVVTDKPSSQRFWQQKFEEKPEIPIKQVSLRRKTSLSPSRDSQNNTMVNSGRSNQGLTVQTSRDALQSKRYESDRTPYEQIENGYNGSFYSQKSLNTPSMPYFQFSANRFKSPGMERSQSPASGSTLSAHGFRELIGQEILNLSKTGKASLKKDPNYLSSSKGLEGWEEQEINSGNSNKIGSVTTRGMKSPKEEKKPKKLNYVIVDAGKRFRMPRSPKYESKVEYKKENGNMQKSIKHLNHMIN